MDAHNVDTQEKTFENKDALEQKNARNYESLEQELRLPSPRPTARKETEREKKERMDLNPVLSLQISHRQMQKEIYILLENPQRIK